jgi:hypothetical protein
MAAKSSLMLVFVVLVLLVLFLYLLILRSRYMNLTDSDPVDKPRFLAPRQPNTATTDFKTEADEWLAAPFAEEIEDIAKELIAADPQLTGTRLDFGTAPDGSLEIWLGDKRYTEIAHLPDPRLQAILRQAVARYHEQQAPPG